MSSRLLPPVAPSPLLSALLVIYADGLEKEISRSLLPLDVWSKIQKGSKKPLYAKARQASPSPELTSTPDNVLAPIGLGGRNHPDSPPLSVLLEERVEQRLALLPLLLRPSSGPVGLEAAGV